MSEEKQRHHLFHRKEDNEEQVPGQSADIMYGAGNVEADEYENALKEEKHHKRMEELGGLGAAATGEFVLVSYLYNIFILIFTSMRCIFFNVFLSYTQWNSIEFLS